MTLVQAYENKHFDFGPADPVEAIKFRMEQQGLTARESFQWSRWLASGRCPVPVKTSMKKRGFFMWRQRVPRSGW